MDSSHEDPLDVATTRLTPAVPAPGFLSLSTLLLWCVIILCVAVYVIRLRRVGGDPFLVAAATRGVEAALVLLRRVGARRRRDADDRVDVASVTAPAMTTLAVGAGAPPGESSAGADTESPSGPPAPRLINTPAGYSSLLTAADVRGLTSELPSRCIGKDWELLYSTERDGYALATLFARAARHGPTMLVVMTEGGGVLGGFAARDWSGSDISSSAMPRSPGGGVSSPQPFRGAGTESYFGSGETFVFSTGPLRIYRWSRRNNFFQLAKPQCLAMGGGGRWALWLDAALERGSSGACETFDSPPLAGGADESFRVMRVELWGFTLAGDRARGGASSLLSAAALREAAFQFKGWRAPR